MTFMFEVIHEHPVSRPFGIKIEESITCQTLKLTQESITCQAINLQHQTLKLTQGKDQLPDNFAKHKCEQLFFPHHLANEHVDDREISLGN